MLCAIHLSNATSNLLEVMPILLLKHLVALPVSITISPAYIYIYIYIYIVYIYIYLFRTIGTLTTKVHITKIVYCSNCVNVVSFCCSLYAINTTIVLLYVMIYAYNI